MAITPRQWFGGAVSAFVNGFIDGVPAGSTAGGILAGVDGKLHADLGLRHIAIEAAHLLAVPVASGLADVRAFQKTNAFPPLFGPVNPPAA